MIWFISDTHYHHKNIVRGVSQWTDTSGCRDFDTLEQHNAWLVNMINTHVARQDTLYHLGDWSFGGKDQIRAFRDQLNCERIHLILGNHDHHIAQMRGSGFVFESVQQYKELDLQAGRLVLFHYPIESWINMERGVRHLHGHVHGQGPVKQGRYDVGVDAVGLTSLDTVMKLPTPIDSRHTTIEGGNKFG